MRPDIGQIRRRFQRQKLCLYLSRRIINRLEILLNLRIVRCHGSHQRLERIILGDIEFQRLFHILHDCKTVGKIFLPRVLNGLSGLRFCGYLFRLLLQILKGFDILLLLFQTFPAPLHKAVYRRIICLHLFIQNAAGAAHLVSHRRCFH